MILIIFSQYFQGVDNIFTCQIIKYFPTCHTMSEGGLLEELTQEKPDAWGRGILFLGSLFCSPIHSLHLNLDCQWMILFVCMKIVCFRFVLTLLLFVLFVLFVFTWPCTRVSAPPMDTVCGPTEGGQIWFKSKTEKGTILYFEMCA